MTLALAQAAIVFVLISIAILAPAALAQRAQIVARPVSRIQAFAPHRCYKAGQISPTQSCLLTQLRSMTVPWQEFHTARFERGIAVEQTANGSWRHLSSLSLLEVPSPALVQKQHGVRPVVALGTAGTAQYEMLIPSGSGRLLDIYRSELGLPRSVTFAMEAMIYHTKALARWASIQCADFARSEISDEASRCVVASPEVPYFEFESLVSSIIQGYEYTTVPLWKRYGNPNRPPKNFQRALELASQIPSDMRDRLERNRNSVYDRAKAYRDCIHHNVDMSSWASMECRDPSVWTVLIRVPDNPKTKSRRAFRFDGGLDALTLGWEYVSDFFAFVDDLFGARKLSST